MEGVTAVSQEQVFDTISELLPSVLGKEVAGITADTQLMAELGMRSASMLELLLELEDNLDIAIEVEDIDEAGMRSVGDLAKFVATHSSAAG
jgi:acyl carrier protein